jgi:glycosyltransferase involved in cell wall biosynthesis
MECVCDDFQQISKIKTQKGRICLYTGTTERVYGIEELVEAFKQIEDAELWICGTGDADDYLKRCSEQYSNIKFYGFLDKENVAKLRDQCDYLINPRRPSGTYTKYSFPSKTIEYLMSGKPCIMYKLEGIPDEYDQYLNYLTGETAGKIKEELINVFNKDYNRLLHKAADARRYVQENKSSKVQASKIITLLKKGRN